jgi:hypothetical protein
MSRAEKTILVASAVLLVLILVLDAITPRPPDWTPSFTQYRNDPYACSLVRQRLPDLFPQGVSTVREPIYATAQQRLHVDSTAPRVNHVFIQRWFSPNELDVQHLLKMVAAGDNAFIAAENFSGLFSDTLGFANGFDYDIPDTATVAGVQKALLGDTAWLHFTGPLATTGPYPFARGGFNYHLIDSMAAQVLAENGRNDPVLIRLRHGKGWIYLCSTPLAFTNYYLLKDASRGFMERVFDLLPDRPVLWDEFGKVGREGSNSPLRYILSQPPLRWAYWTVIVLLLLIVFVFARRRQRAIPVVEAPRNTSRDFADTIGRLYYFRGDHADLARKLCAQFKDEVRRKLRLAGPEWNARILAEIAARTGIGEAELQHAARLMDYYATAGPISEQQLLDLNKTLDGLRKRM